ncbi:hypothetical protein N7510_007669 [Penicillium lagena]|uniref:uncharacterized protein n=1 Tax=Penicillium lagena TaxID=94218 RepID=UPI00253FE685|nr:uncharacterized protein N7510_007669 [Penicillium lagena]KAJ5610950.1 hypothetical protein N7510_007669 [Penicillium lagena]
MRTPSWTVGPASIAGLLMIPLLPVHASVEDPRVLPAPPMGFNNWARFECDLNQTLFTETAEAMAKRGLRDAGYDRLNLDDCWLQHSRSANGSLQWNTTLFPQGIPWLARFVKNRGFQLGIYEDSGNQTCGGYPGSYGHEQQDAETFASWGIDYLKLDGCNVYPEQGRTIGQEYYRRYHQWHEILSAMAHPLIFSESAPAYFLGNDTAWSDVMDWIPFNGELARHSDDILVYSGAGSPWDSIMSNYHYNTLLVRYQQPGYYNDPDFLIPDHPRLSAVEKRSQFALWASQGAPLIISAYIPGLSDDEIKFLSNKDLIAVDQDPLAQQAALVSRDADFDVLTRTLANGDRLVTVLNRGNNTAETTVSLDRMGLVSGCGFRAKDLVSGDVALVNKELHVRLASHATSVHRLTPPRNCGSVTPTGMVFGTNSGHCLTASGSSVTFETCNAADSQVWSINDKGSKLSLSPLSDQSLCLAARNGNTVSLAKCRGSDETWSHFITGHLQNDQAGGCLTESAAGAARLGSCSLGQAGQILGLPSGVKLASVQK